MRNRCLFHKVAVILLMLTSLFLPWRSLPVSAEEKPSWQVEWEKTVAAAKKEGQVNIYSAGNQASIINAGVFQKRYPEVKVVLVAIRGSRAIHRILSERRARKYLTDVHMTGGSASLQLYRAKAYDPIKPALILPEVADESRWWHGRHHYGDPERKHNFVYIGAPRGVEIYYNTNLVDPKDFKSVRELLNPRWRGKIVTYDMRGGGPGGGQMRFIYHHPKLGPRFIHRLFGDMDMTLVRNARQATDWLATGKFAICFVCSFRNVRRAKHQGLPVDILSVTVVEGMTGLTAEGGGVNLVNRAPHPNAARVFINWLLSREGQITAQKALAEYGSRALDSMRIDIPKDDVPPEVRRIEGVQYIDVQDPKRLNMRPIFKIMKEALHSAQKKKR